MISVDRFEKSYTGFKAVDGISFEVESGQILGFLGPNGAGKTTTMKVLTCFMPPTSGTVTVDGLSVTEHSKEIRKKIGYFPEHAPIYADMNVVDYLQFVTEVRGIEKSQQTAAIKRVIEITSLGDMIQKDIGELSKGFRQRVGLAQAMVHNPDILILDEPTTGLDPNQIVEIRSLIKEIGKEKTVIFSTHILQEVTATCDNVMIINKGKIVAKGTPEQLTANAEGKGILNIELNPAANGVLEKLSALEGVTNTREGKDKNTFVIESAKDTDVREAVFNCAVQNKWILMGMNYNQTSLEDVFRQLTE
jgi:gliding motility-associated transport system ATP-binding protein